MLKLILALSDRNKGPGGWSYQDFPTPKYLYHGTSSLFLPQIKLEGLSGRRIHLTMQRSLGNFSAKRATFRFGGEPVVLTIDAHHRSLYGLVAKGSKVDMTISHVPYEAIKVARYL